MKLKPVQKSLYDINSSCNRCACFKLWNNWFLGLIIPHISRAFAGTNHKRLVPVVILLGAIFLIWADVLARVLVKNAELPIGIFTALVGAPFFIYIVTKKNYGRE